MRGVVAVVVSNIVVLALFKRRETERGDIEIEIEHTFGHRILTKMEEKTIRQGYVKQILFSLCSPLVIGVF